MTILNSKAGYLAGAILVAGFTAGTCAAEDDKPADLSCHFDTGHTWSYEGGKFVDKAPNPLVFDVTDINLDGQSAKLVSDGVEIGRLRIVRALNANSFLEVANEGFLNLTTIYDLDPGTKTYPAVHSRHFGLLGQPVFAQYAGRCTAK